MDIEHTLIQQVQATAPQRGKIVSLIDPLQKSIGEYAEEAPTTTENPMAEAFATAKWILPMKSPKRKFA